MHTLKEFLIVILFLDFYADKSGTVFLVVFLRIFECGDIIICEYFVQKLTQCTGTLRKIDDKIIKKAFVNQGFLFDFLHSANIIIAAANYTND